MIHEFARCPSCGKGVLAVDDDVPTFVFDPDSAFGAPCRHLALATACLSPFLQEKVDPRPPILEQRAGVWVWSHSDGLRGPDAQGDELGDYLTDLACDSIPYPQIFPRVTYHLTDFNALDREKICKGSGVFPLANDQGLELWAKLYGWALYSRHPAALVADIRKRIRLWQRLGE
jgi:hypothetical protein